MSGRRSLHDLNGNGVPDKLEKNHGLSDKNGDGIDDKYESKSGLGDRNGNGIKDKYEYNQGRFSGNDLNGNGISDQFEGANQYSRGSSWRSTGDLNGNGIPDSMERMNLGSTTYVSQVLLPTKVIEKPAAVHEEIRREQVEEIQPVINIEKLKTEVHQVTQPLVDREVRAVGVSERMLATEILPQINRPTVALRSAQDVSTVSYRDQTNIVVEKPALYMETQKKQIIEEIQPVIYKETIVPTLIKETKQIYQTVVEGTTYVHQTLPVQQLKTSVWSGRSAAWGSGSDLNGNGIPDQFEGGNNFRSNDLNGNGIPDQLEGRSSFRSNDLNGNGIPDQFERGNNFRSNDLNGNGIPDQLEGRSSFRSNDLNGNGIPDQLEGGNWNNKLAPNQAANSPLPSLRTL